MSARNKLGAAGLPPYHYAGKGNGSDGGNVVRTAWMGEVVAANAAPLDAAVDGATVKRTFNAITDPYALLTTTGASWFEFGFAQQGQYVVSARSVIAGANAVNQGAVGSRLVFLDNNGGGSTVFQGQYVVTNIAFFAGVDITVAECTMCFVIGIDSTNLAHTFSLAQYGKIYGANTTIGFGIAANIGTLDETYLDMTVQPLYV